MFHFSWDGCKYLKLAKLWTTFESRGCPLKKIKALDQLTLMVQNGLEHTGTQTQPQGLETVLTSVHNALVVWSGTSRIKSP